MKYWRSEPSFRSLYVINPKNFCPACASLKHLPVVMYLPQYPTFPSCMQTSCPAVLLFPSTSTNQTTSSFLGWILMRVLFTSLCKQTTAFSLRRFSVAVSFKPSRNLRFVSTMPGASQFPPEDIRAVLNEVVGLLKERQETVSVAETVGFLMLIVELCGIWSEAGCGWNNLCFNSEYAWCKQDLQRWFDSKFPSALYSFRCYHCWLSSSFTPLIPGSHLVTRLPCNRPRDLLTLISRMDKRKLDYL